MELAATRSRDLLRGDKLSGVRSQVIPIIPQVAPHAESIGHVLRDDCRREALKRDRAGVLQLIEGPKQALELNRACPEVPPVRLPDMHVPERQKGSLGRGHDTCLARPGRV